MRAGCILRRQQEQPPVRGPNPVTAARTRTFTSTNSAKPFTTTNSANPFTNAKSANPSPDLSVPRHVLSMLIGIGCAMRSPSLSCFQSAYHDLLAHHQMTDAVGSLPRPSAPSKTVALLIRCQDGHRGLGLRLASSNFTTGIVTVATSQKPMRIRARAGTFGSR
jgi:hypothetical protein